MIINDKEYRIPELDFNAMCKLEDMGISLTEMDKKVLTTIRGFMALAIDGDMETAGNELEKHLASGGSMEPIMEDINKAVSESGFFRSLRTGKEAGDHQSKKETAGAQ